MLEGNELNGKERKERRVEGKTDGGRGLSKLIQGHHPGQLEIITTVGLAHFFPCSPSNY